MNDTVVYRMYWLIFQVKVIKIFKGILKM